MVLSRALISPPILLDNTVPGWLSPLRPIFYRLFL